MNSIRSTLVVMLIAAFTLVSFLAALNGYLSSMREAETLMDKQLQHASEMVMGTGGGELTGVVDLHSGSEVAFQVWRDGALMLRSSGAPRQMINELTVGFRYANFSGSRWRTLTQRARDNRWYIVAERADLRHMLAEKVVLESIVPMLLWLPVSAVLIWILVGWGLRPLRDLSLQINQKRSDDLESVQFANPPAELVQLIDSTNSLLARLSAAFEREKHFAAHAAHELRTPLSVLKVHLHNLAGDLPPTHHGLAHANAGVERMHHLVEQILDLNRTNPDIIKANFRRLDLFSLAQRVTADAWPGFSAKQQSLSLNGASVIMFGVSGMLETLLQNILDNAGKYTAEGGEISVFAGREEGRVRLRVEDSGPGIAANEEALVFTRFYRGGGNVEASASGSGLGLAIVQHMVQLHNAEIRLGRSQFSTGLAVTIDFQIGDPGIVS